MSAITCSRSERAGAPSRSTRRKRAATLGARLRRLSERIDSDASRIYADAGLAFEQRWFGVGHLLEGSEGMSVGELAEKLGIRHVSVSQTRDSLEKAGIVACETDPADARRRTLKLTRKGRQLVAKIAPLSAALSQVAIEPDEEAGSIVAALERLDQALDRRSLLERVRSRIAEEP